MLQKIGPIYRRTGWALQTPFRSLWILLRGYYSIHPHLRYARSCTSTTQHNAQHFFSDRFCQSHGQTSALHWFVEECNGFLLQCTLTIDLHPQMFPTDQSKIAFLITSLTGLAFQWAETILNESGPATQTFSHFLAHFREVFGSSPGDSSVGEQLFQLRQGTMPIHQYSLKFRTLAAASGWNEPSILTAFRQGLNSRLPHHLAAYDDTWTGKVH